MSETAIRAATEFGREFDTGRPGNRDWLQEALTFRGWGWSVIPIGWDKKPTGRWKVCQWRRMTDKELGRAFAGRTNVTGLAVVLGRVSGGLACRDFDTVPSYHRWAVEYPTLAATLPTVRTARGYHVYLRAPWERFRKYPDGEYRGKGYVILPPSIHPFGHVYEWVRPVWPSDFRFLNPVEAGLLTEVTRSPADGAGVRPEPSEKTLSASDTPIRFDGDHPQPRTGDDAIAEAVLGTQPSGPGERNACLFRLATTLKQLARHSTAEDWRGTVERWWRGAMSVIRTRTFGVSWSDFCRQWEYVGAVETLAAVDRRSPLPERLRSVCVALSRLHASGVFHLSDREAERLLGVSDSTANRLKKAAVTAGWLEVVYHGRPHPKLRRASEYRLRR